MAARLRKIAARAEQPQNELELRNIRLAVLNLCVRRVSDEVEPRNAEPRLVHRVVKQGVILLHMRHADDGVVLRKLPAGAAVEPGNSAARCRLLRRREIHSLSFVQNKKSLCLICRRCTHGTRLLAFSCP